MVFDVISGAVGAVGGAVAAVVSQKVYSFVKVKIVAAVEKKAEEIVAKAKKAA
jgi:hypothetical protein